MDADAFKKQLSGMAVNELVDLLEVVDAELRERDLTRIADELAVVRGMLLQRLYGLKATGPGAA